MVSTRKAKGHPSLPLNPNQWVPFQARSRKVKNKRSRKIWSKTKFVYLGTVVGVQSLHQRGAGENMYASTRPAAGTTKLLIAHCLKNSSKELLTIDFPGHGLQKKKKKNSVWCCVSYDNHSPELHLRLQYINLR